MSAGSIAWARFRRIAPSIVLFSLILLSWEWASRAGVITHSLSSPTGAGGYLLGKGASADLWLLLAETMNTWALGLGVTLALALPIGITVGASRTLERLTLLPTEFLRSVPPIVYLPIVVLVFGTSPMTSLVLIVSGAIWSLTYQVIYGVRNTDPVTVEVARVYGLSNFQIVRSVYIPSIAPFLATGLRIAAVFAIVATLFTEMLGTGRGIGGAMMTSMLTAQFDNLFGLMVLSGILGIAVDTSLTAAERRLLRWHPAHRDVIQP